MKAEVPPGYKQTEVGVIPEEWDVRPIGDICWVNQGLQIPISKRIKTPTSNSQIYITIQYLNEGKQAEYIDQFTPSVCCTANDVLMTRTGNTGIVVTNVNGVFHNNFFKINFDKKLLRKNHLVNFLSQEKIQRLILVKAGASTIPDLNHNDFYSIPIVLPSPHEQEAIAAALSEVDGLLAKLDQLIAKKRDLKQAAMQQLLSGQTRLPGYSGAWEVKRLGDLFTFSGGLTASRDQLSDSGHCYLHYGDIHKSTKSFIDVEAELMDIPKLDVQLSKVNPSSFLKEGDVVFVDASEDGEGASRHLVILNHNDRPYISGLHTIVAKSRNNSLDNRFKRYCFQTRNIKEQFRFFAVGTKVSGISKTSIAKIELNFPLLLAEQTAIATVLSDMDAEIASLEARRAKTHALKQGMMQELLTGRIRLL